MAAGQQGPYDHQDPPERDSSEPEKPDDSKTEDAEERRPEPIAAKDDGPKTEDSKRPDQSGSGGPHEDEPRRKAERKKTGDERRRDEHVHMPSDVDARGEDKYRKVIGQHNPNRGRQLDKAPAHNPAKAPWAQPGAPQGPLGGFAPRKQGQKGPTHFQ